MTIYTCASTGAEEIYRCRTNTTHKSPPEFTVRSKACPCDQVIYIRSAVIGFSTEVYPNNTEPNCPALNGACMMGSAADHSAVVNCHGSRACTIPQSVLDVPPNGRLGLCKPNARGNFIKFKYDCVNSGKGKR